MKYDNDIASRKSWADVCRVVAIFGVIVIHACGAKLYSFGKIPESEWLQANFLDSLVRCSVPLFVMLSGALLLNKNAHLIVPFHIFKRITKVLIPLFFWNILYLLYVAQFTQQHVDWWSMFRQAPMYHLWFVYMLIGLYLLLPIFQAVFHAIQANRGVGLYLFLIWVLLTCIPIYQPLPFLSLIQQTSLLGYGGYFLLGACIVSSRNEKRPVTLWIIVYLLSAATTFGLTWMLSVRENVLTEKAFLYFSPNILLASIASFVVLAEIRIQGVLCKILYWVSDRSFLIYFVHVLILERVQNYFDSLALHISTFAEILVVAISTFVICLMIASALRIMPKSRILVG
jgi:surface polysaccharide O-acyltransferase-like enzyme